MTITNEFELLLQNMQASLYHFLPSFVLAIIVFVIGLFIIRRLGVLTARVITRYANDPLIADFLVNISSFTYHVLLVIICLSVLGWGSITNKILAGAGITTFIVGFALKDIGENFLAGALMAFRRPFRVGDLIEIDKISGRVTRMTLRETIIKTLDGKDVYIPNGMILRVPLFNHTMDNHLRNEFSIELDSNNNIEAAINTIHKVVDTFRRVDDVPPPRVQLQSIEGTTVRLRVQFWYEIDQVPAPGNQLRSDIMLKVLQTLQQEGFLLPVQSVEVHKPPKTSDE